MLIEALALGAPIVATRFRWGADEILESGSWGSLVPVGDPHAMAAAMSAMLKGTGRRPNGLEWARQFNLEAAVDRYLTALGCL